MIEKINNLKAEIAALTAADAAEVEALRIKYLSKKVKLPRSSMISALYQPTKSVQSGRH